MQTFVGEKDPAKHFLKKLFLRGKLQNLGFLGFLEKTYKLNMLIWGAFGSKMKNINMYFIKMH